MKKPDYPKQKKRRNHRNVRVTQPERTSLDHSGSYIRMTPLSALNSRPRPPNPRHPAPNEPLEAGLVHPDIIRVDFVVYEGIRQPMRLHKRLEIDGIQRVKAQIAP